MRSNKGIQNYLLLILGIIAITYFIVSLIFYWGANVVFLLVGGLFIFWGAAVQKNRRFRLTRRQQLVKKVLTLAVIMVLLSFAAVEALIISGGLKADKAKTDYVIILGASLRDGKLSKNSESRLNEALEYIKENPESKIIVTGGVAAGETMAEATAMEDFLLEQGIDKGRIIKEDRSTSTYENFKYSKAILEETDKRENISLMIITNEFHQYRSRLIAKHLGFVPFGRPAATAFYLAPNCYVREYFAVLKTWVFDVFLGWEVG